MSDTVFADAYTEYKKGQTMRSAMEEPLTDTMLRVTSALDQGNGWLRMVEQLGLRGGKGVALRIAQLKDNWLRGESPSRAILKSLCLSSEFGNTPTAVFMAKLLDQKDPVLELEVLRWAELNIGHMNEEQKKRLKRDADETALIDFFVCNKIASNADEAIEYYIALAKPEVKVTSLHKLGYLKFDDLTRIGIPVGPAAMIVQMLSFAAESPEPDDVVVPPPTTTVPPCVLSCTTHNKC